jgi:hypothetical protein
MAGYRVNYIFTFYDKRKHFYAAHCAMLWIRYMMKAENWRILTVIYMSCCRSKRPRSLTRRSAAAHLLRLWVRIPPVTWMSVCYECCVLSGRGLCDELITSPEESYRLRCVVVCDLETSWVRRPGPTGGYRAKRKKCICHVTLIITKNIKKIYVSKMCNQNI